MESLSRPPHRRKHSTTTNIFSSSFSFKNPYDDVLLPNGGGRKSLEVHDYSEIFAGSSSIPMLDLSLLDERVGSGDFRTSELDYSSIFGGLRNDDVLVPYEELLNGSAKKTKQRIPAEAQPDLQEPGSLHSSRKTKRSSGEASDQSADGVKQQFNISFNRTNQRNGDASDGKTHIAQLHAVPGFTQFLNGTPRLHKKKNDKLPSLKREVSRSWSFSAEVEPVKDKGGSTSEKSQIPGKSHNGNELNLKSQFSIVLTPSSCPSDLTPPSTCPSDLTPPSGCASDLSSVKDPMQSMASNFASKKDASHKLSGESSPPFFGEEFDANSVDAVSAAALKKAIDQAQESIRIAKMIMERKKEAYQEGSKPRPTSRLKVLEKETTLDHEAYGSKDNNAMEEYDELDPIFTVFAGIDGKFTPSLSHSDRINNATNSEVERVWQNVEAEKELEDAIAGESKLFDSNCSQSEAPHIDENVKLEKLEKNVEAAEMHREAKDFPVLVDNAVCRTADLGPGNVGNINYFIPFTCKLVSKLGWFKTSKEDFERSNVTFHRTKGSEFVPELVERDSNTPQGMQGMAKNVEEYESCEASFDHAEGPEKMVGRVLSASQRSSEQDKVVDEVGKKLSISQEGGVYKQRENDANDKEKCGKNLEEHEEMLNVEHLLLRSEFNNVLNDSCNPVRNESLEQEEMEKKSKNVSEWKGNGHRHGKTCDEEISGLRQKEAHPCFRSKEQLKEALLEEVNDREPYVSLEIGEVEKKVNETHKPETDDKKHNHADDGDKPKLAEEVMQNTVEERHDNTCEYEVAGTIIMEATHCGEVQKTAAIWDAEEAENTLGSAERSEDIHDKCQFQEAAYEEDIDEAVDLSSSNASTIFDEAHNNDASTIIGEIREACDVDLDNKAEEHQKAVTNNKENDTLPEVNKTVSAIDNDKQLFHMQDNEMIGTNSLHQSGSEEIFVQNEPHDAFEGLSSDGKKETVGVMAADPEENLPEDEDVSRATSDIHDASEEYAAKINRQNLPELLASDIRTAEFDLTDVRQVTGRPSESDEGSVSASSSEKIDGLSAHESEECAENVKDRTSEKGDLKDDLEMVSDERKFAEELNDELYSQLRSEPNKLNKPMETETAAEIGLNMEKNKDNIAGTSPTEERDAKEDVQNPEGSDQQQRIEAIKRGRARERDRLAVERAIREARERAFAEARERVERAAVERAAAEVRQRVMEEAREKVEKASVVKQPIDKASTEAKLRAERAAVERATAEARERALEKAMSQKISTEARTPADRHPTEGFSGSSRNSVLKHSFSSSDLETGTESAQRRKARLERHQRIMERAAKALAEKNMRDLLAQKEQAERNRLAESLDADIKRWATGKEGNLRALLSTLQYILGPDSGWQPISLTEIITTAAVKKAYRKATLYVHPDKLQQRGASVQQKYICEKVFDLLKAAWNRFNSDER